MNAVKINKLLKFYKERYYDIQEQELYKWEALQHFQEVWDIDATDFPAMLENALSKNNNLGASQRYNAHNGIIMGARKEPVSIRQLFRDLYDESCDVEERISYFKESATEILQTCGGTWVIEQDVKAIVLYLTLRYPNQYYLYKYGMFKNFADFAELEPVPNNDIQRVLTYFKVCDEFRKMIIRDEEIIKLYQDRHNKYGDTEYHMLVQDIIYSVTYYQQPSKLKMTGAKKRLEKALDETYSDEEREEHARQIDFDSLVDIVTNRTDTIPKMKKVTVQQVVRDPYIAEYAKRRADGVCQLCMRPAPFKKANGDPYLESHHIIWLSEGGTDSIENTVALCPNCHRKMHVVNLPEDVQRLMERNKVI